jgi:hypothetical protein
MGVGATGSEADRYPADSATDPAVMAFTRWRAAPLEEAAHSCVSILHRNQ